MKRWGGTLVFLGVASMILHSLEIDILPFTWFGSWGEIVGWIVRSVAVVLGTGILIAARNHNLASHT